MILQTGMQENKIKKNGFILLELIIVCVIITILFTFIWPSFNIFYHNYILESAGKDITSTISYARDSAIFNRLNYKLNFNQNRNDYWITLENDPVNSPGKYDAITTSLYKKRTFPKDVIIKELSSDSIIFNPDGITQNFYLSLENKKGQIYKIILNMNGNLQSMIGKN